MFDALNYGGGVDLWNVPKAKYKRFTKVVMKPASARFVGGSGQLILL